MQYSTVFEVDHVFVWPNHLSHKSSCESLVTSAALSAYLSNFIHGFSLLTFYKIYKLFTNLNILIAFYDFKCLSK